MDKLTLAHSYMVEYVKSNGLDVTDLEVRCAFDIAEAMLAENEKRTDKTRPQVLREDPFESLYPLIDWNKYGKGLYHFWAMDEDGQAFWHNRKPEIGVGKWDSYHKYKAPSFDYQGNWKDSLRERK